MHDNVELDNRVNFDIIQRCIKKLKPHKDDGNYGFKSDHLINGSNKLFIIVDGPPVLTGCAYVRSNKSTF